jgi:hypothetical protein
MAFQFVDPTPFIPRGYNRVMIPDRRPMSRVILGRPSRRNLDLAIATIHLLPHHQVQFNVIRDVLADFLGVQARVGFRSIQPCPLGQAFVCFNTYHDRDQLIQNSPRAFGDVFISFTEHDRGRNHRAVTLNHEVWLMLLGTNVDFWSDAHIHKIIGDHGQVIAWEEDHNNLARVLIKVRVVNLEDIPWFIVSTEGPGFEGDSWTIQTEIIQTRMLGVNAADENIPPGPDDLQPEFFDFFGFGQPHLEHVPENEPNDQNMEVQQDAQGAWGLWPEQPENQIEQQGMNVQHEVAFDLNEPGCNARVFSSK